MAPNLDVNDDAPPPRKKAKTAESASKVHCRICYSEIEGAFVTPCRACKKPTCFDCVKGQWLAALSDHERMPVRCCGRITYHDVVKDILPPAELAIYKLRFDEAQTPKPFYCPVPTCSAFIPPRMLKPIRGKVTCHLCATISCFKCRRVASNDHICPETDEKTAILKSFNYKLCPKCGTGLMRMFGCAHVRCACGAHWCWDCQRPINACYMKPCSTARDDGQNPELDDADTDSEDEEAVVIPENREASGEESVVSSELSTVAQNVPADETSTSGSGRPSSEDTAVAEAAEQPAATSNPDTAELKQDEQTAQPEDTVVNLDDPYNPAHDWEGGDLDFGDEPSDEYWDVWGCMHKYREFVAEDIPDQWLLNLDLNRIMAIECMACFKTINIEPLKPFGPKTFEESMATRNQEADHDPEGDEGADVKAVRKEKRRLKKHGAFECKECGVIHCWWCRRAAIRQMSTYRKGVEV